MRRPVSDFEGPRLLHPPRYEDPRGFFSETWSEERFREAGIRQGFVQDNHSCSNQAATIRGLHFQIPPHAQAKLVRVARGSVFDVIVDLRLGSPTFRDWGGVELSVGEWNQLYVPEGFAHGYCTLEPDTHVIYKVSSPYRPNAEGGLRWDDPKIGIEWPELAAYPIVADRDQAWPSLAAIDSPFRYAEQLVGTAL